MEYNIWIVAGLSGIVFANICAFLVGYYALARVRKLSLAVYDLDWAAVGDLVVDVQKLKKQVQRYRNIENGEQHTQTNQMIKDLEKQYYNKNKNNVTTMVGG
jgi:hypothetical protein